MLSQHSWARCANLKGKREFPFGGREGERGEGEEVRVRLYKEAAFELREVDLWTRALQVSFCR